MSQYFLRVDLRENSHDFRRVALQPGMPLLDSSNTNYRMLQKWFGIIVAQPHVQAEFSDSVGFCVCDEQGRRIVNAKCEPLTQHDLAKRPEIAKQWEELKTKFQVLQPNNPKETMLLTAIRTHFNNLSANPSNLGFSFFQYKNGNHWQLVWLWGFERRDAKPAAPALCKRNDCRHLVARRVGETSSCPVCQSPPTEFPKNKGSHYFVPLLLLCLVLFGGGLSALRYFLANPQALEPEKLAAETDYFVETIPKMDEPWKLPVGARVQFKIYCKNRQNKQIGGGGGDAQEENITDQIISVVDDPRIARIDRDQKFLRARSPGDSSVSFHLDKEVIKTVKLTVEAPSQPKSLTLDPSELVIGVGTTYQLTVLGHYADHRIADLTDVAVWKPLESAVLSNVLGFLEGLDKGTAVVAAQYRATETDEPLEADCKVEVFSEQYSSIKLQGVPEKLYEDFSSKFDVVTYNAKNELRTLTRSPKCRYEINPPEVAVLSSGNVLKGISPGKATLKAVYDNNLTATADFEVLQGSDAPILVNPSEMKLGTGETAMLDVVSRSSELVDVVSSDASIAEVIDGNQVIGRTAGNATVTVSQNGLDKTIPVEVADVKLKSLAFSPNEVTVAVNDTVPLRLVGKDNLGREREIASDQVSWQTVGDEKFCDIVPFSLDVHGIQSTGTKPQMFIAQYRTLTAPLTVNVVAAPMQLELSPCDSNGKLSIPVDQQAQFSVCANYGDRLVSLAPDQIEWIIEPKTETEGIVWDGNTGICRTEKPSSEPLKISAKYQGQTSNQIECSGIPSIPSDLQLAADKPAILVGEKGNLFASPQTSNSKSDSDNNNQTPSRTPYVPVPDKYSFQSADPKIVKIDPKTGQYEGVGIGETTVSVSHPVGNGTASTKINVTKPNETRLELRPNNIEMTVGDRVSLKLVQIENGKEEIISINDPAKSVVCKTTNRPVFAWNSPALTALTPAAPFQFTAEYQGRKASTTIEIKQKEPGQKKRYNDPNCQRCQNLPATADKPKDKSKSSNKPEASDKPKPAESQVPSASGNDEHKVEAEIEDQPFYRISLGKNARLQNDGRFKVIADIEAIAKEHDWEYRFVPNDENGEQSWILLKTDEAGRQSVQLESPPLEDDIVDKTYPLMIEVRDRKTGESKQHPLEVKVKGKNIEIE